MVSLSSFFYLLLLQQIFQVIIARDALQFLRVGGAFGDRGDGVRGAEVFTYLDLVKQTYSWGTR